MDLCRGDLGIVINIVDFRYFFGGPSRSDFSMRGLYWVRPPRAGGFGLGGSGDMNGGQTNT